MASLKVWTTTSLHEMAEAFIKAKFGTTPPIIGVFVDPNGTVAILTETITLDAVVKDVSAPPNDEKTLLEVLNKMLRHEEGYKLTEYLDSKGYPTIGIGHLIVPIDRRNYGTINGKLTITPEQADELFKKDVANSVIAAKIWLGAYWNKLSVNRQAVVVGMAFQMGKGALEDFGPTRDHIIREEWVDVKDHFLGTKWYTDTPYRVKRMAEIMVTDSLPKVYNT
jgi:GH24 family phage-related lysozyme (muramidase)